LSAAVQRSGLFEANLDRASLPPPADTSRSFLVYGPFLKGTKLEVDNPPRGSGFLLAGGVLLESPLFSDPSLRVGSRSFWKGSFPNSLSYHRQDSRCFPSKKSFFSD